MSVALDVLAIVVAVTLVMGGIFTGAERSAKGYWWWSEPARLLRERKAKINAAMCKYIILGFDEYDARRKAERELEADAEKAEKVV